MSDVAGVWAEVCPDCDRHFTDLAAHRARPCARVVFDPPTVNSYGREAATEFNFDRWVEVFWSRVGRRGPDECWPWLNAKDERGYGVMGVPLEFRPMIARDVGATTRAHRVAWALENGPIPVGAVVRHRCDKSHACCNPAHLLLGHHRDNANDEAVKNRMRRSAP
jgi:hypothetical protein